jgi:hypothetical protein
LLNDPTKCAALTKQIRAAATSVRLAAVEQDRRRLWRIFQGDDRTSDLARQFIDKFLGKPSVTSDKVWSIWNGLLNRLARLKDLARDFGTIDEVTCAIGAAGAPKWARMLSTEKAVPDDPRTSPAWREAWDHAAADAQLARIEPAKS